jgi:hypothetical protein
MRYAAVATIMAAAAIGVVHASDTRDEGPINLCVFRYEDNGAVNIVRARIVIDKHVVAAIVGGSSLCLNSPPGMHSIEIYSRDPYAPTSRSEHAWRSEAFRFNIAGGSKVYLRVSPAGEGSHYIGRWQIELSHDAPRTDWMPNQNDNLVKY